MTTHPLTWFGEAPADRRRAVRLIGVVALLSPLIAVAELSRALGVPCH